jgi:hypothetical protein
MKIAAAGSDCHLVHFYHAVVRIYKEREAELTWEVSTT